MATRTDGHQIVTDILMPQAVIGYVVDFEAVFGPVTFTHHASMVIQGKTFLALGTPEW